MRKISTDKIMLRMAGLKAKVLQTTRRLVEEHRKPAPNHGTLQRLKKTRLRLKDEIRALSYR
ncbi:MAG: DUF465 domain-containing protein [Pseudomonadota bacterium]